MLSNNRGLAVRTLVGLLACCFLYQQATDAFAPPGMPPISCVRRNGLGLGAKARNGMEFDDITLGEGRRVLPGDTVYCYYVGSFAAPKSTNSGPLGALLGGGAAAKPTVFDKVSTFLVNVILQSSDYETFMLV